MNTPKRYNPLLVTLHWLTVILMLGAGFLAEDEGNSPINIHMILGAALLAVLLVRIIVRFTTKQPEWADTGNPLLNQLGGLVHLGLYLVMVFILGFGAVIAYQRNLFAYVMGTGSAIEHVRGFTRIHHLGWIMAMGLILLHVGAAFYHQFILRDNLLARMWYGNS